MLSVAGWIGNRQYTILKSWPTVQAEVTKSELVRSRDSHGNTMYQAGLEFRYKVGEKEYVTPTSSNVATSSYSTVRAKVNDYAAGTHHFISYNPADPNDIRFDVGYNFDFLFLPALLGGMGFIFGGLGVGLLLASRSMRELLCPSCGQTVEKGQKFCPNCAAPLSFA